MRSTRALLLLGIASSLATRVATAEPAIAAPNSAAPEPSSPAPTADAPPQQPAPTYVEPPAERPGFVLSLPLSVAVPGGELAEGVNASSFGAGMGFGVLLGFYATEHLGVLGGFSGSHSHQGVSNCAPNAECKGYRYQVPVVVQYALRNRKEGLYFQGGLGFASTYGIVAGNEALTVSAPFDLKLGVGYRLPVRFDGQRDKPSRHGLELFAQFDYGQFDRVSETSRTRGELESDIARPSSHHLIELGVAFHWTP